MTRSRRLAWRPLLVAAMFFPCSTFGAGGHQSAEQIQRQIEQDVWIPLLTASDAFDAAGFLAVQSADLVRVAGDTGEISGLANSARSIRDGFARARARGVKRKSDVRFLSRSTADDLARETGYFRSVVTMPDGEVRTRYTRFEFLLRREQGRWRILVDQDSSDSTITEEMFLAAAAPHLSGGR